MPTRPEPPETNYYYHVFNRGITNQDTFLNDRDYQRAITTMPYYFQVSPKIRFSYFQRLSKEDRLRAASSSSPPVIKLAAYCLMPNHFHLLLKQVVDNGISNFVRLFTNSYTRYFNTKHRRNGPLFQGRFKAVLIESEEQLIHVSRYIHLNPSSSGVVSSKQAVLSYPYSSIGEYLNPSKSSICEQSEVLSYFSPKNDYKSFVLSNADYQRELQFIKHLTLDLN